MADEEHVALLLEQGVDAWNTWRQEKPDVRLHLSGANLSEATLSGANPRELGIQPWGTLQRVVVPRNS
jgi:uncharacterized protein YjbI with pentapeptide repeats